MGNSFSSSSSKYNVSQAESEPNSTGNGESKKRLSQTDPQKGPSSRPNPSHLHQPHPLSEEGSTQKDINHVLSPVDSQGVTRGSCDVVDCTCTQYGKQPHGNKCGNCGHFPVEHIPVKLPLKDDSQPAAGQYTDHYSGQTIQTSQSLVAQSKNTSLAAAAELPGSTTSANKCAITECSNPRYVDPSTGALHMCCGYTHAMEHQRRQAIQSGPIQKGITHCLLPECSLIVWPFMNYCGSTHADLGKQRGLMPPIPVVDVSFKDDSECLLPICNKKRYTDQDGTEHFFCGRTHGVWFQKGGLKVPSKLKCIIPTCKRPRMKTVKRYDQHYCSQNHIEKGRSSNILPKAESEDDVCAISGCDRMRAEGAYCSKEHKHEDAQRILTKMEDVNMFLKQFKTLKVKNIEENPNASPPDKKLFKKFHEAWKKLSSDQRQTVLAFHGTPEKNIKSICNNGYDSSKRYGQAYGAGEYFATEPSISMSYCCAGKKMLLNELLLGSENVHHTNAKGGTYIIMKDPAHELPRFVIEFE